MIYVLYNPLAGNNRGESRIEPLKEIYKNKKTEFLDITKIESINDFLDSKSEDDEIIIAGGDGTLSRFVNAVYGKDIKQSIYYYPAGSGNDFVRDVGLDSGKQVVSVNKYMSDLPDVYLNDEEKPHCKFLNGLGYGLDGYCCEIGDKQRKANPKKKINYTMIALKGLLYDYKPRDAIVTVDGKRYEFKKVYMGPIMHGRYYGGGYKATPDQDRLDPTKLSVLIMHGISRLKCLLRVSKVKKGTHVKYEDMTFLATGHDITVEYSTPCALQIDGETVLNVKKIRGVAAKEKLDEEIKIDDIKLEQAISKQDDIKEESVENKEDEEKIDASIDISNEKIDTNDITSSVEKASETTVAYSSEEEQSELEKENEE